MGDDEVLETLGRERYGVRRAQNPARGPTGRDGSAMNRSQRTSRSLRAPLAVALLLGGLACTSDEKEKAQAGSPTPTPDPAALALSASTVASAPADPAAEAPLASATAAPADAGAAEPTASASAEAKEGPKAKDPPKAKKEPLAKEEPKTAVAPEPPKAAPAPAMPEPAAPAVKLPAAVQGSADAVAEAIDAIYVPRKTFHSKFKQEHTQKVSGVVKKSSGTVYVQKPNKLSFRYDPPNRNRIVSDGSLLKIYVAEDQQMIEQPVGSSQYPGALGFLMGNGIRPSFTFSFHDKAKFPGGKVLVGKPRSPTPHYENVLFYVDDKLLGQKDPNAIRRVLILDAQGNRNRFDFENATQPASIPASEFTFTPPAGTNVVKQ